MPIKSTHPTVGTSATLLCDGTQATGADPRSCVVVNPTGSANTVYLGGADVSSSNGISLVAGDVRHRHRPRRQPVRHRGRVHTHRAAGNPGLTPENLPHRRESSMTISISNPGGGGGGGG